MWKTNDLKERSLPSSNLQSCCKDKPYKLSYFRTKEFIGAKQCESELSFAFGSVVQLQGYRLEIYKLTQKRMKKKE